jgi:AraC-like DNA-binding protein
VARLRARLEADDDATPMGPRVRAALTRALLAPGNDVRLEPIADALALRPRTLQARLAREGLAFSALVDAVKSEETQRLLEAGLAASEVARRLGFADASALRKARRRWAQGAGENR